MKDTIELTEPVAVKVSRHLLRRAAYYVATTCAAIAVITWSAFFIVDGASWVASKANERYVSFLTSLTKVEVIREMVPTSQLSLNDAINKAAREMHVPAVALKAIARMESADGQALYRFEPLVFSDRAARDRNFSEDERRMLSSSHGALHVMGFNAKTLCNIHWSKLYDTLEGVKCGAKILRAGLDSHVGDGDFARRLWLALRDYNGRGSAAELYAERVYAQVGVLMIGNMEKEL